MEIIIQVKQTCVPSHTGEKEGRIGIPFTVACLVMSEHWVSVINKIKHDAANNTSITCDCRSCTAVGQVINDWDGTRASAPEALTD